VNQLFEIIRSETAQRGVLPFARFMELALYCPNYGYYEKQKDNPGSHGDFYTSVSTGELFGQLLAFQFSKWLEEMKTFNLIEAGAHDGKLAKDILNWLQSNRQKLFGQIEYIILEPSPRRQEWQRETLKHFENVRWLSRFNPPPLRSGVAGDLTIQRFNGIIFSNELLDAFPVHRFGWDAKNKKWFEWGVAFDGKKFIWAKIQNSKLNSPFSIFQLPSSLLDVLPDGYIIETSPTAENCWREAAGILQRGKLMTIDYGFTADEMFSPARTNGTLRGYFRHHLADDLLANHGEQDLTAHVNFSAIQKIGKKAGLKTENFCTQPQFLTQILAKAHADKFFGEWDSRRARQFQTLTHPEHLGRAFKVLVQAR
jgi:SAM-dependent MidA family methyltransferase